MAGVRQQRIQRARRKARCLGALGFLTAAVLPVALFGRVVSALEFAWQWDYLLGWMPWFLLGCGLLFLLPVALSAGMNPENRFFPRSRGAYAGWGVSLYLLGLILGSQVAQLQGSAGF
jgi:hypothetical protein